ncbi:zinc-dependent metalloprotease [uncultured Actinobaculum sp.]|uniref:zinc-dependent metalloprotease n=1 Tax=uncultured Actinobaculum sp. TaxID=655643 RepID=UPI002804FD7D|nr:zinc-dependent metalloprotease [uncultured Actinobaculum sp.]
MNSSHQLRSGESALLGAVRKAARSLAGTIAGRGPAAPLGTARQMNADLIEGAQRAVRLVPRVAHLDVDLSGVALGAVSREGWLDEAAPGIERMFGDVSELGSNPVIPVGFSFVARSILGQYEPYAKRLTLVAPNIYAFEAEYDLNRRDVSLWVAAHELTHAAQFEAAPWLKEELRGFIGKVVNDGASDLAPINALMSVLEGHAEYVMNELPSAELPTRRQLERAIAAKREAKAKKKGARLREATGIAQKARQYSQGKEFVRGAIEAAGVENFNHIWHSRENFPTPAELAAPEEWVRRVIGEAGEER